jgi:hypothetical protein
MYRTDRSPGNDATLGRVESAKDCRASRASRDRALRISRQVPAVNPHARPGRSLSEDCHKSPRSLPPAESAKSSASQDAPGIPSSARDHSLALGQTNLSGFSTCVFSSFLLTHGPIIPAPEHQVFSFGKTENDRNAQNAQQVYFFFNRKSKIQNPKLNPGRFNPAPEHQVLSASTLKRSRTQR